jgi:hypothetical protein
MSARLASGLWVVKHFSHLNPNLGLVWRHGQWIGGYG